jgi:ATP-binding cassette subfamily B protein
MRSISAYVLHDGVLQEQGTYAELIAAGGRYATLFALQSAGYQSRRGQPAASRPQPT